MHQLIINSVSLVQSRLSKKLRKKRKMKPHKCPVCDGLGERNNPDYDSTLATILCKPCEGKGVLWSPEPEDKHPQTCPFIHVIPYYPQPYIWNYPYTISYTTETNIPKYPSWSEIPNYTAYNSHSGLHYQ